MGRHCYWGGTSRLHGSHSGLPVWVKCFGRGAVGSRRDVLEPGVYPIQGINSLCEGLANDPGREEMGHLSRGGEIGLARDAGVEYASGNDLKAWLKNFTEAARGDNSPRRGEGYCP